MKFLYQYFFNLALSYDQWINAILLGDPDDSISGRCGRAMKSGKPKWWVPYLASHVDWIFLTFFNQIDHCLDSIEDGEKYEKELWKWQRD